MNLFVAFDIDGVIRDVSGSYRRALADTVEHFGAKRPAMSDIDALKAEGCWNNDWLAAQEFLRREHGDGALPDFDILVSYFQSRYLGEPPGSGYIASEPLLISLEYFQILDSAGIGWGFFSGASRYSARHVLVGRLGLQDPALVAMHEAPEKPDPTGLIALCDRAAGEASTVLYVGDTVADMQTVVRARAVDRARTYLGIGFLPPHIQHSEQAAHYTEQLVAAGANQIWNGWPEIACFTERLCSVRQATV